jgi:hypothetical protein
VIHLEALSVFFRGPGPKSTGKFQNLFFSQGKFHRRDRGQVDPDPAPVISVPRENFSPGKNMSWTAPGLPFLHYKLTTAVV